MALLALSDPVANTWERLYGDVLAGVTTTSLYGAKQGGTQYSGMKKHWKSCGESPGEAALRPDRNTLKAMKDWMAYHHPEKYWELYQAKRENGQPLKRSSNERARVFCYQKFGIDAKDFQSGHVRGVYFARRYENTDAFLRGEIEASELKRKHDHSPEALTEYWRKLARKRAKSLMKDGRFSTEGFFLDSILGASWEHAKQM